MNSTIVKYQDFEVGSFIKYISGKSEFPGKVIKKTSNSMYLIEYCVSSKDVEVPIFDRKEVHVKKIKKMYN